MGSTGPEQIELFALELLRIAELYFVSTLACTDITQSAPNLIKMHVPIRSQMSSILGSIGPKTLELFAFELRNVAELDFVYTLTSVDINQSAPDLLKMYATVRSQIISMMDLIRLE